MKLLHVYVDTSVIGGCEHEEFAEDTLKLWSSFISGKYVQMLSEHTLRELANAPSKVRARLDEIPERHQVLLLDSDPADDLAQAYLDHRIVGPREPRGRIACGPGERWRG